MYQLETNHESSTKNDYGSKQFDSKVHPSPVVAHLNQDR
jgi:hypothetical protein